MAKWRIVGISFDHMHMGDLLRMAHNHPDAEIVGLFDADLAKMKRVAAPFNIADDRLFTDFDACMKASKADLAILCAATGDHASYTERLAAYGVHVFVEKPFAASVADARRMMAAMAPTGKRMAINWPLAWVESHVTAKRLIDEGLIGDLLEVRFYGGNRGPLYHLADKVEVTPEEVERQKPDSWWYKKAAGGGSLLDYLGYGATLGTWYMNGEAPLEVTCVVDEIPGIEVDQHSITVCRYARGLSKMETRWGTFTDPWMQQPQPKCGFVFVGADGTIASEDYSDRITVQTRATPNVTPMPVDPLPVGRRNGIEYMLACLKSGAPITGPLEPELCLTAQRIVDTAAKSAAEKRTLALLP
ncbi:Gfo/Idh/MocA family oxidoreductase [Abyssibius alkaniclasticus]|uniref:Gfo/Idh/MocA family protein n=1 Tax=Abyssibius alkaniclasticus TaxID=2881234 RepID=UPI002363BAC0|nr:Gfo/Idh/MocA family oxidoreductase [Abyssibius alkaniclasticus]UPH70142.1 Gfo/Idh/MocA family oxidoreductase [Abyssibius alkaniclasticus]|tara:strand:+ start:296 stop:1372 length:1077 start_codon:yes stop_codon:yes gene_type:complete